MQARAPYLLLYDGECRICAAFARAVRAMDLRRRIRIRPIQDARDLLSALPSDSILDAAHAVAPDGRVTTGADALPTLLGALLGTPRVERWARSSRAFMRVLSRVYGILVELRGHLTCGFAAPASAARSPR